MCPSAFLSVRLFARPGCILASHDRHESQKKLFLLFFAKLKFSQKTNVEIIVVHRLIYTLLPNELVVVNGDTSTVNWVVFTVLTQLALNFTDILFPKLPLSDTRISFFSFEPFLILLSFALCLWPSIPASFLRYEVPDLLLDPTGLLSDSSVSPPISRSLSPLSLLFVLSGFLLPLPPSPSRHRDL